MSPRLTVLSVLLALLFAAVGPAGAMPLGKIKLVSHATTGSLTGGPGGDATSYADYGENYDQAISGNGRYLSFLSDARNLQTAVTDDASSTRLFRADLFTGGVQMVDVNPAGTHNADGPAGQLDQGFPNAPTASADGRFVVWHSGAQNLVSGFLDGGATDSSQSDIYMRDMQTGVTTLLSRSTVSATQGGNNDSSYAVVSPSGRFVLMSSRATDLVSGITDTNNAWDVFLRDTQAGTTTLVTAGPSGAATIANGGVDYYAMTPDGKYVVFTRGGNVSDVISGDTGTGTNLYRRNMDTGVTELLSPTTGSSTAGAGGVNGGIPPVLSDDGRYVTFSSTATTLVPTDTNGQEDVFVRDATDHTTTLVSHNAAGTDSATGGQSSWPRITPDGHYVVWTSPGTNVVTSPPDTAGIDVFRFDRLTGVNTLVSVSADGTSSAGNPGNNTFPLISDDGRFVAFESASTALVNGFVNNNAGGDDIFKRDMTAGTTSLVSSQAGSSVAGATSVAENPWMTPDGRFVSFDTAAPEIVSPATSSVQNVYVRGNILPTGLSIATSAGANAFSFGFTGSATDPDGSIGSFGWNFGDGATATGSSVSHSYGASGTDTVTLTATDDEGESSSATTSVSPAVPAPAGGGGQPGGGGGTGAVTFALLSAKAHGTSVSLTVRCPSAGRVTATMTAAAKARAVKRITIGHVSKVVTKAGTVRLTLVPNKAGKALLKRKHKATATVKVVFAPAGGGAKKSATATVTLRATKKKH